MNRPYVQIWNIKDGKKKGEIKTPEVYSTPIRTDIISFTHKNMNKNHRQPYAVKHRAGMGYSAHSWGPGRARARVPRIHASGTRLSGAGAFASMCRGGRMFAPTQVWRKWHKKTNKGIRRYAVCSALAASASVSLVFARGHNIHEIKELPLVVDESFESIKTTVEGKKALKMIGGYEDVEKVIRKRKVRSTKGKGRNRRYVQKKGPLVVYEKDNGIRRALQNLPGVDLICVDRLNLLELAPGGHLGRFIIWTEPAFKKLDQLFGASNLIKSDGMRYKLPRPIISNPDITRIINSIEFSSVVRARKSGLSTIRKKVNPLKNKNVMQLLNPYDCTRKTLKNTKKLTVQEKYANTKKEALVRRVAISAK